MINLFKNMNKNKKAWLKIKDICKELMKNLKVSLNFKHFNRVHIECHVQY
jgi:hypothetical protein